MEKNIFEHITGFDLKQFHYENNCWQRSLAFMKEENIHLKTRLAEILNAPIDAQLLEKAEHFQTRFIKGDEFIRLLRDDLAGLEKLAVAPLPGNENMSHLKNEIKKIRTGISKLENFMATIKSQFNSSFHKTSDE